MLKNRSTTVFNWWQMMIAAAGVEVGRVANFLFCGFLSLIISDNPTKSQAVVFCNRRLSFFSWLVCQQNSDFCGVLLCAMIKRRIYKADFNRSLISYKTSLFNWWYHLGANTESKFICLREMRPLYWDRYHDIFQLTKNKIYSKSKPVEKIMGRRW